MASLREESRSTWDGKKTIESINAGSLQRIADAMELMSQNYVNLQNERDRYKKWYYEEIEKNKKSYKRISILTGVITRLKNKASKG